MNQLQRILIGALIAQILLAVFVWWPRSGGVSRQPLFDLTAEQVKQVSLHNSDGKVSTFTRSADGWSLADRGDFSADKTKIEAFLNKVVALQTGAVIADDVANYVRLQVADDNYAQKVTLQRESAEPITLYLGSTSGSALHVRRADQTEVYLVTGLSSFEADASLSRWIDTSYVALNSDDVVELTLTNANGTFQFVRDEQKVWAWVGAESAEFNAANFTTMLSSFSGLRLSSPLGKEVKPEYGLDTPTAKVGVRLADGKSAELLIGGEVSAGGELYAKWSESPYYVSLARFSAETFQNKSSADFTLTEPTPNPTALP